jgi:outer membrane protein assembly factor BamB
MPWLRSLLVCCLCTTPALAEDWPQWLGPRRDGSSSEQVQAWKEPPKVVWRKPVSEGNSSPVIAAGRVFIHQKVTGRDEEEVVAFDAQAGKEQWRVHYARAPFQSLFGSGPRATPTVAGDHLYAFGVTGVLTCFEAASGKQVWQVDTLNKFKGKNLTFGLAGSPLVEGRGVLVNVGATGASIVAFDRNRGDVLWQALDDGASYASPIAFGSGKERQAVFLTQDALVSISPENGSPFWRFPMRDMLLESSTTPVRSGDILFASSITYGSVGLRLDDKDGKPAYQQAWKDPALTCYFSTPVAVGEYLYVVTGSNPFAFKTAVATLHCIEVRTGKERWKRPNIGKYHAALLRTGNDKLLLLDDAGNLMLVDPNPKEYRELARAHVCGETWAHPALAHGRLYVRDNHELICLALSP